MTPCYHLLYQSLFKTPLQAAKQGVMLSALCLGMTAPAIAAEADAMSDAPSITLPKMTVTATRVPTAISNTIAQTRIIDSEALERYKGQTVLEVIKRQPGISFTQSGGMGTTNNFYIRGYDNKQVLVLIDGMRYGSATTGQPALNLLPAEQIERIEVVYGASGSSIYGSDAMGGVIQLFTKGQEVNGKQFSVTAGIGSNAHYLYGATAQFATHAGTSLSVAASRNQTDGFNAVEFGDNYHPDDDGYKSSNASVALQHQINDKLTAGMTALYADSTTDIDDYPEFSYPPPAYEKTLVVPALANAYADQRNGAANAYVQYDTGSNITKLSYGHSIDESTTYDNALSPSKGSIFNTQQNNIRLENVTDLAGLAGADNTQGQVIMGAEYLSQAVDSTLNYLEDKRHIASAFVGYQYANDNFNLQSNYRLDDNSQFGRNSTYNLGAAIKPTQALTIGANYAKGFRAPNFNELYWPDDSSNADLHPETSDNYEAFISLDTYQQNTRLTAFYNQVDDLIVWSAGKNNNVNEAQIKGASLTSDWQYDALLLGASYTYQEAKDTSGGANEDNLLPYRPKSQATAYVGWQMPKFDMRLEGQYIDKRYTSVANTQALDSYTLFNLAGNYHFTPQLTGSLRIDNITDEDYTLSSQFGTQYATEGTNYFGALTYTWQ